MRLNKFLAQCGVASRRKADELIFSGRVTVNGKPAANPGMDIDESFDEVCLDGKVLSLENDFVYVLLNKPRGCITSVKDDHSRKTVIDLIGLNRRIFPVGRLDYDTEGVLLLINDGELAYRLTHPKFQIEKIYEVRLDREFTQKDVQKVRRGVDIGDRRPVTGEVRIKPKASIIQITVHQGRKRQIKRMMAALGYNVISLKRIMFGPLDCKGLKVGQWRYLTDGEIKGLRKQVRLQK